MKTKRFLHLRAALAVCASVGYGVAQLAGSTEPKILDQVASLIAAGKPAEARNIIATIPTNAPEYRIGKFYDALAFHVAGDQLGFFKALEKLPEDATGVPVEVAEDLAAREVQTLHFFRKFDELLSKAREFVQNHAGSTRCASVKDYLLAGLFDRGMKKTEEACRTRDESVYNRRWPEGKANLEEFLALAASTRATNYWALPKRSFRQDKWVARLTLGDEKVLLEEVPAEDAVTLEGISYLRVQLYHKLQREKLDQNIGLAESFLRDYPQTKHRKRLEFDLATLYFRKGERLAKQADADETARKTTEAESNRAQARAYFEKHRALQVEMPDKDAGIEASDLLEMRADLLYGYILDKRYEQVTRLTAEMLVQYPQGSVGWSMAKVNDGCVALRQAAPDVRQAIKYFEQVIELGFKDKPDHDYYVLLATKWRI